MKNRRGRIAASARYVDKGMHPLKHLQFEELLSIHGLIVLTGLLVYVVTTHSLRQRRSPTAAISWVLVIALVPYVGLPLYLLFGTRKLFRTGAHHGDTFAGPDLEDAWPQRLAAAMDQPPVAAYQNLCIHADGGEAKERLWALVDSAEHQLDVCTFIIGRDPLGKALLDRLVEKARQGLRVRLLVDDVGRMMSGGINVHHLRSAGLQVKLFGPVLLGPIRNRANLRNHRKMLIADGQRLWCGGRNFAAEYFEGKDGRAPWRDLSFDLVGPLAAQGLRLFESDWNQKTEEKPAPTHTPPQPFGQIIASGPDQPDDTVHDLLVTASFKARDRIIAVTPYFVPDEALLMSFVLAARRGVAVDLILPDRSNHRMADFSRQRALRRLTAAGGRAWLVPYMLHAKAIVVDETLALAGSVNLDSRSLLLNYEMMIAFYARADIRRFADLMHKHRESAHGYTAKEPGLWRDFAEGLVLWVGFQL